MKNQTNAGDQTAEFFGTYLEVTPNLSLDWTNEEGGAGGNRNHCHRL